MQHRMNSVHSGLTLAPGIIQPHPLHPLYPPRRIYTPPSAPEPVTSTFEIPIPHPPTPPLYTHHPKPSGPLGQCALGESIAAG